MPLRNSGGEISLRHLPDVSDTSFSFQIPGSIPEGDLLADDGLDFFQGVNLSAGPPNSPPTHSNAPLTLTQVTPTPAIQNRTQPHSNSPLSFPTASTHYADNKVPDLKEEKPMPCTQRPKLNTKVICQPRPRFITPTIPHLPPAEGSPAGARLEALRAQVDSLFAEDLHVRSSDERQELVDVGAGSHMPKGLRRTSLEKVRLNTRVEKRERQTRMRQAISNSKDKNNAIFPTGTSPTTIGSHVFSHKSQSDIPKDLHGDEKSLADTSMSSLAADGAAARLLQYSQELITSFGLHDSDTIPDMNVPVQSQVQQVYFHQDSETGTEMKTAQREAADDHGDGPLTVSQLSPRKTLRPPTPTPPASKPMSPLRPSSKRPVSVPAETRQRKKSRSDATDASSASSTIVKGSNASTRSIPSRPSSRTLTKSTASDSVTVSSTARDKPQARVKTTAQAPVIKVGKTDKSVNEVVRHASKSTAGSLSSSSTSNQRNAWNYDTIDPGKQASSLKGKNKAASSLSHSKTVLHAPLHATRPVEFKLQTDSRLETRTRKGNPGNESTSSYSRSRSQREKRPIPDFKAIHAAQEAELVLRKENIRPIVPLPIKWETEERLRERHKFDDMVREKERENTRLMEEKRKEQAEQEERELRELRKKAIPKANEVPEWYKEAPKKKDKKITGIGG
ncbi:hypothetical protein CPB84DRAFT_1776097 [Gymnopilus junonius]|uniref:TPX2 C-terminal domain-containing protein n=1 Tax=Gymnopilus junonius TaxID=109634 RepID=A0A9P5TNV9_GYMJU|nr:hypothetical protein CPB84DRAFT_1776097 [Gymnopilus junonius]